MCKVLCNGVSSPTHVLTRETYPHQRVGFLPLSPFFPDRRAGVGAEPASVMTRRGDCNVLLQSPYLYAYGMVCLEDMVVEIDVASKPTISMCSRGSWFMAQLHCVLKFNP